MPEPRALHPWVLVAGGFHELGGMDRANLAVARVLAGRGAPLHLVAHRVDPELAALPGVTVHRVPRPAGSFLLGEGLLDRRGRAVARAVARQAPAARVLVNGGNCAWPDVNWVHAVHHAWPCADTGAPAWFRAKNRWAKRHARAREQRVVPTARLVIANSERTRRDVVRHLGVAPERVATVYLGSDPGWRPPGPEERAAARARLGLAADRPLVAFVGALSHDHNKGFDTLWAAWQRLAGRPDWRADLAVAGGGSGLLRWRGEAGAAGIGGRVRFLGFTDRVGELLAAADLLVAPSRYEAYGLNVHEAVCRGVPALASATAGIAELFPPELADALLPDPEDAHDLAARLRRWGADPAAWRGRFAPLGERLRRRGFDQVAREVVELAEGAGA